MAKPDLTKWVTDDDAAKISDPGSTKKLAGFIYTERPPFQYFNWLFNRIHKWLLGLQGGYFDIVVGSATQVTDNEASHVISDLDDTLVVAGSKVLLLAGTHTLAANLLLTNDDISLKSESPEAIIDVSTFTITISGARTNSKIRAINAGDGDIIISGAGSKFIGIDIDYLFLSVSGGAHAETTGSSGAIILNGKRVLDQSSRELRSITATINSNALTLGLLARILDFRSASLTNGAPNSREFSNLSLVVPSGATLGTIDTIQSRLILLAIDNAGTVELAVVNSSGGVNLDETILISTTAIDVTSDSNNVIYSTTARTNVPFRVVGFVELTQAVAGTWATAPTLKQGAGGNALTSMSSLGYGQTWQSVTRTTSVTYYNTTGKPIVFNINITLGGTGCTANMSINGGAAITFASVGTTGVSSATAGNIIIPVGASYLLQTPSVTTYTVDELR